MELTKADIEMVKNFASKHNIDISNFCKQQFLIVSSILKLDYEKTLLVYNFVKNLKD